MPVEEGSELLVAVGGGPATMHNVVFTHRMASVECSSPDVDHLLPFVVNEDRAGFQSFFSASVSATYGVEWECERARRQVAPNAPSRFGCLYLFATMEDARTATALHQWSSPIVRARVAELRGVHTADMETISLARSAYAAQAMWNQEETDYFWRRYWEGKAALGIEIPVWVPTAQPIVQLRPMLPSSPIWEVLLDGVVELLDAG
jgi:hypothetical protein